MSRSDQGRQHHQLPSSWYCPLLNSDNLPQYHFRKFYRIFLLGTEAWLCTKSFHIWWSNIYDYPCTTLEMMRGKGPLGLALTISGHRDITPSGPGPHHTSLYVVLQDFLWTGSISEVAEALGSWIPTWIKFEASVNPAQPAAGWGRCYKEQFQPQTVLKSWVHLPLPLPLLPISLTSKTSSSFSLYPKPSIITLPVFAPIIPTWKWDWVKIFR